MYIQLTLILPLLRLTGSSISCALPAETTELYRKISEKEKIEQ
jgi:hypothetical protein